MALLKRQFIEIPINEIPEIDDMFFKLIEMNKEKTLKRFSAQYEETRAAIFEAVTVKGVFDTFSIDYIDGDDIHLTEGTVLPSHMLANLFAEAEEVVFSAITVEGFDALADAETDNLKMLFNDGWGSAIAECGHSWLRSYIKEQLSAENINATFPWCPGQHEVDIRLQKQLFALLKPEDIGITLSPGFMMHPQKSVSSFIGIGHSKDMETVRACDFCRLRETCPTAYA